MQVPSLHFFIFFVARSRVALWTPFFNYFDLILSPFGGLKMFDFWIYFWIPEKVGSKGEKDATTQIRRSQRAPGSAPEHPWGGLLLTCGVNPFQVLGPDRGTAPRA